MTKVRVSVDHAVHDGVGYDFATPDTLARYNDAHVKLSRFRAPVFVHAHVAHEKLFLVAFDGTGNNRYSSPGHPTNVALIHEQISESNRFIQDQVISRYIEGPGVESGWLAATRDHYGRTDYESNIQRMYDDLVRQANQWVRSNPASVIRVHSIGFSRGASQIPGFARLLHEHGIPELQSETILSDGVIVYTRMLVEPGQTAQAVGLFDPVATGIPVTLDRRLPPSVISGFQLCAGNERRIAFLQDRLLPPGTSDDKRFLSLRVPGAHSDVGGGYKRDGLSTRCGNFMRAYCNALRDEPYLTNFFVQPDRRLNVIHLSSDSKSSSRQAAYVLERGWITSFFLSGTYGAHFILSSIGLHTLPGAYVGGALGAAAGLALGIYRTNYLGEYRGIR